MTHTRTNAPARVVLAARPAQLLLLTSATELSAPSQSARAAPAAVARPVRARAAALQRCARNMDAHHVRCRCRRVSRRHRQASPRAAAALTLAAHAGALLLGPLRGAGPAAAGGGAAAERHRRGRLHRAAGCAGRLPPHRHAAVPRLPARRSGAGLRVRGAWRAACCAACSRPARGSLAARRAACSRRRGVDSHTTRRALQGHPEGLARHMLLISVLLDDALPPRGARRLALRRDDAPAQRAFALTPSAAPARRPPRTDRRCCSTPRRDCS